MTTAKKETFRRTYSVLVENEPGVLSRISGLFSARGFNIRSLSVGETIDSSMSRMTIVVEGTPVVLEQVNKQLNKLIPVISVLAMTEEEIIAKELILVKLSLHPGIESFVENKKSKDKAVSIVHQDDKIVLLQVVLEQNEKESFFLEMGQFEVKEICRSGNLAISKSRNFSFFERN